MSMHVKVDVDFNIELRLWQAIKLRIAGPYAVREVANAAEKMFLNSTSKLGERIGEVVSEKLTEQINQQKQETLQ